MQLLTKLDGTILTGYWNGKQYGDTIYFNVSKDGTKQGINFEKSEKFSRSEIKSIKNLEENKVVAYRKPCLHCGTYCYGDCQA